MLHHPGWKEKQEQSTSKMNADEEGGIGVVLVAVLLCAQCAGTLTLVWPLQRGCEVG